MSRLDELIRELCPDGVEYKNVGEVCEILRGKRLTKSQLLENGKYPVLHGGLSPLGYYDKYNRKANTTIVVNTGNAGSVYYYDKTFWSSDACFSLYPNENVLDRFLFYCVSSKEDIIKSKVRSGAMPTIDSSAVGNLVIPVPPLPVQREIVRILDNFTELTAELTAELNKRQKQYEYYRDLLLTFNRADETVLTDRQTDLIWISLSDLVYTRNGYTPSKDHTVYWTNGSVPWFRMEDIRENGRILSDAIQKVSESAVKGQPFPQNSIIVATSATIGEHALITVPSLANQRFTYLMLKEEYKELVNMKFIYYYCFKLDDYCKENLNQGNFASVDMKKFAKFIFPIPSLEVQRRIVSILDHFDALCNDLTSGLPAEIEARQKQYEYYRDKLLTFKPKEAAGASD